MKSWNELQKCPERAKLLRELEGRIEKAADVSIKANHATGVSQMANHLVSVCRAAAKTYAEADKLEKCFNNMEKAFSDFLKDLN